MFEPAPKICVPERTLVSMLVPLMFVPVIVVDNNLIISEPDTALLA